MSCGLRHTNIQALTVGGIHPESNHLSPCASVPLHTKVPLSYAWIIIVACQLVLPLPFYTIFDLCLPYSSQSVPLQSDFSHITLLLTLP